MKVKNFSKYRKLMFAFSLLIISTGIVMMFVRGFNLGIDFATGITVTVTVDDSLLGDGDGEAEDKIKDALGSIDELAAENVSVQKAENDGVVSFFVKTRVPKAMVSNDVVDGEEIVEEDNAYSKAAVELKGLIISKIAEVSGDSTIVDDEEKSSFSLVDPTESSSNVVKSILLVLLVFVLILIYISFRFKVAYALASIAALVHDVLVMLGVIAIFGFEVNVITITAVLTVVGYSLNDTIVVFDRIRENSRLMKDKSLPVVIDTSITQSLSRTVITSLTTLFAVVALAIFAVGEVRYFGINMIVGILVGTYSSIFIASPVYLELTSFVIKRKAKKKGHDGPVIAAASGEIYKEEKDVSYEEVEIPKIERKMKRSNKKKSKK
jgi:preprotein translocase subunit SecF